MGRKEPGHYACSWTPPDYEVGDDEKIVGLVNRRSPNNWGMRYSSERDKTSGQLEYPVAREYMRAMRLCLLEQVQWGAMYLGPEGSKAVLKLSFFGGRSELSFTIACKSCMLWGGMEN